MSETEQLKLRVEQLEKIIAALAYSDRYVFHKNIQLLDGRKIQLGTGTGTMIGTVGGASGQKLSFWAQTPVVQPAAPATTAAAIIAALQTIGIFRP